jgi:hypothetical protein
MMTEKIAAAKTAKRHLKLATSYIGPKSNCSASLTVVGSAPEHWYDYAVSLLIISKLVNSQAATINVMVPIALSIGVSPGQVAAFAGERAAGE